MTHDDAHDSTGAERRTAGRSQKSRGSFVGDEPTDWPPNLLKTKFSAAEESRGSAAVSSVVCGSPVSPVAHGCENINRSHTHTTAEQTTHTNTEQQSNGATTLNSRSRRRRPQAAAQRCASALEPAHGCGGTHERASFPTRPCRLDRHHERLLSPWRPFPREHRLHSRGALGRPPHARELRRGVCEQRLIARMRGHVAHECLGGGGGAGRGRRDHPEDPLHGLPHLAIGGDHLVRQSKVPCLRGREPETASGSVGVPPACELHAVAAALGAESGAPAPRGSPPQS